MIFKEDTICAIATAAGSAGIGTVRLSGPEAVAVADRLFSGRRRLSEMNTYTAAYGQLVDETGRVLDEVIALVMRAPHTYTTEDVVELSCHGGPLVMRRVLEAAVRAGARMAEPGEFTRRAYLGGRIDLSEAEAVMDVISAENDRALSASMNQLRGSLKNDVTELREKLLYETAYIESALDDPENYSLEDFGDRIRTVLDESKASIKKMLREADEGRLLRGGIRTAIIGRPNAGKSSILNLLLGEDRAIVTDIAGTTRDTLEERALLGGVQLVLIDTAGIRETEDTVEKIGVKRAKAAVDTADLILLVVDAAEPLSGEDRLLLKEISEGGSAAKRAPVIVLLNKNDLTTVVTAADAKLWLKDAGYEELESGTAGNEEQASKTAENEGAEAMEDNALRAGMVIEISAATGEGKQELEQAIHELFFEGKLEDSQEKYLLNARHKEALSDALSALSRVSESVDAGVGEDFYTIDLLAAYEALGRITGETLEDDLADKIFAEFCMGK